MQRSPDLKITITELMNRWPLSVPVFIKYRMYCVGCSMAIFDTLEEAIKIYELPQKAFLEDLRAAIPGLATESQSLEKQE